MAVWRQQPAPGFGRTRRLFRSRPELTAKMGMSPFPPGQPRDPLNPHRGQLQSRFARVLHTNRVFDRDVPTEIPQVMRRERVREVQVGRVFDDGTKHRRRYIVQRDGSVRVG